MDHGDGSGVDWPPPRCPDSATFTGGRFGGPMLDLTFRQPAPMTKWAAFRTYWAGYFVSMAGDCFTLLALPIAAYRLTQESWLVGLVDMMEILSGVLRPRAHAGLLAPTVSAGTRLAAAVMAGVMVVSASEADPPPLPLTNRLSRSSRLWPGAFIGPWTIGLQRGPRFSR